MPIELQLPALSESMETGSLARWLKSEGDPVQSGEAIAEIETDKAMLDFEAPATGMLVKILIVAGTQNVAVGTPIGVMMTCAERETSAILMQRPDSERSSPAPSAPLADPPPSQTTSRRRFASPVARRVARQEAVDLSTVTGSGPGGRIVLRDVAAMMCAESVPQVGSAESPDFDGLIDDMPFDEIKLSAMRQVIARRLTQSKRTIPHFYLSADIELDELLTLRKSVNAAANTKISVNDFLIKALAIALNRHPDANVQFNGDTLRRFSRADISVAVAIPGGLITPIVRAADSKTLTAISTEMKALVDNARAGKLAPGDYQGGSFSLSNLGMFGVKEFSAIINPPQAGILAVGAAQARAVVKDGQVTSATVMTATIAFDHRAIDGALGAQFLSSLKYLLENPLAALLSQNFI